MFFYVRNFSIFPRKLVTTRFMVVFYVGNVSVTSMDICFQEATKLRWGDNMVEDNLIRNQLYRVGVLFFEASLGRLDKAKAHPLLGSPHSDKHTQSGL